MSEDLREAFAASLKRIIDKYQIQPKVWAVGVSGGADSLALAYLLKNWSDEHFVRVVALTVNHQLRPEADAEAEYTAQLMKKIGVEHHILQWLGVKPESGIEEAAREARYGLLQKWCAENGVPLLLIAHNQRDQAETFLMRLQRGSGVDLREQGVQWVEDPSNRDDEYLRVRIRKMLPALEEDAGISVKRLAATAARMNRVRDYLEQQTDCFVRSHVTFWENSGCSFLPAEWQKLHQEMRLRVLLLLLKRIGGNVYPPRLEETERLEAALMQRNFKNRTLSKCEIISFGRKIWIVREKVGGKVLSRQSWEKFAAKNPKYLKAKLPYRLRLAIYEEKRTNVGTET